MKPVTSVERMREYGLLPPIAPRPSIDDWRLPTVDPAAIDALTRIPRSLSIKPTRPERQWLDPARDTRAQAYKDKGYTHDRRDVPFVDGWAYEIGRFHAGIDTVGFVKYVGTWVDIQDPPGTEIELDFSNPYTMQDNGLDAEFLLRLDQGTPDNRLLFPDAPWSGPVDQVTGYGYNNLPFWNDYRFYWGRYANNVWWLVPERHAIRLYIHVKEGSDILYRVLGRLQGYTQPAATLPAAHNVSHGW